MPDKIFSAFGRWEQDIREGLKDINNFLAQNENYEIKSITNVSKSESEHGAASFAGVIVVVGERRIKRIRESK